jgi:hypothetical protein
MNRRVLKPLLSLLVLAVAGLLTFVVITPAPAAVVPVTKVTVPPIGPDDGNAPEPSPSKTKGSGSTSPSAGPTSSVDPSPTSSANPSATPSGGTADRPEAGPTRPCAECQPEV